MTDAENIRKVWAQNRLGFLLAMRGRPFVRSLAMEEGTGVPPVPDLCGEVQDHPARIIHYQREPIPPTPKGRAAPGYRVTGTLGATTLTVEEHLP